MTNYRHSNCYKQIKTLCDVLEVFKNPVKWDYLGEAATVLSHDVRVRTFQFPDYLKALVELGEDVHHRAGEQSVLRRLLELRR